MRACGVEDWAHLGAVRNRNGWAERPLATHRAQRSDRMEWGFGDQGVEVCKAWGFWEGNQENCEWKNLLESKELSRENNKTYTLQVSVTRFWMDYLIQLCGQCFWKGEYIKVVKKKRASVGGLQARDRLAGADIGTACIGWQSAASSWSVCEPNRVMAASTKPSTRCLEAAQVPESSMPQPGNVLCRLHHI